MIKAGPDMEPPVRIKAIADMASGVSINTSIKANQYVRSGREMIRSAVNYHEDGKPEQAYTLYMRFLTIFLDKLRSHPGYKEIPPSEKKLMTTYCTEILPKAEALKAELLEKYAQEHAEYKIHLEHCMRKLEKEREEAKKKAEEHGSSTGESDNKIPWKWQSNWPYDNSPSEPFVPDPKSLAIGGYGGHLSGISYSNIMDQINGVTPPAQPGTSGTVPVPQFDRNTKPERFLSPMSSGLRQVVVPADLDKVFLRLADSNTRRNIETCGFLTGKIIGGKLVITDLILTKQEGTSDSCTTSHEEELFGVQDKYDLITFGWIHTHPSQTAFLSSIDMHTHYWHQSMMPEAIAVVCAPSKKELGIFVLTPDDGMHVIGNCTKTSFHPHPPTGTPLFTEASHYVFDQSRNVRVHDLRK